MKFDLYLSNNSLPHQVDDCKVIYLTNNGVYHFHQRKMFYSEGPDMIDDYMCHIVFSDWKVIRLDRILQIGAQRRISNIYPKHMFHNISIIKSIDCSNNYPNLDHFEDEFYLLSMDKIFYKKI